jgi:hypothetical protein
MDGDHLVDVTVGAVGVDHDGGEANRVRHGGGHGPQCFDQRWLAARKAREFEQPTQGRDRLPSSTGIRRLAGTMHSHH